MSKLVTQYPNAVIFCCSIPLFVRTNQNKAQCELNDENKTIFDYNEAIKNISNIMNCQFIDMNKCGFNRKNYYDTYCVDSSSKPTHPNAKGQKVIFKCIESQIIEVLNNLL